MKKILSRKIEEGRVVLGPYASTAKDAPLGAYIVYYGPTAMMLHIMASDGKDDLSVTQGWEHVSVSCKRRCPNWEEMSWVKSQFFEDDEWVVQYHPAKGMHINHHEFCLHMWRHPTLEIPHPPALLV